MGQRLLYFAVGLAMDILVVLYYRAIVGQIVWLAAILAFLLTLVPLQIVRLGIMKNDSKIFWIYAMGSAVGTIVGMAIGMN